MKKKNKVLSPEEVAHEYNKGMNKKSELSIFDWIKKDGEWIHVGFTSDGINIKTYVNGKLVNTSNV